MDLICFSHLRWNFVYQRPQHLLTRFTKNYRVFYVEEPEFTDNQTSTLITRQISEDLWVATPQLPHGISEKDTISLQQGLLLEMFNEYSIHPDIFWYYTPMALPFTKGFLPDLVVYDCMDELSNFKFAPVTLKQLEAELFKKADIVFTGGHNLYQAKKNSHGNIWPVPSSIEKEHFEKSRKPISCPADQAHIPGPRLGFYGVIDERMDIDLIREVAEREPGWNFVIIGPVVKIDPASLPQLPNIHYLGSKKYEELPQYMAGWQMAMIPFLINDSTKYISPTKTPEYLSAGLPVISTPIVDVVYPYGTRRLVHIAHDADTFIASVKKEFERTDKKTWLKQVDEFLKDNSWNSTWAHMMTLIQRTAADKHVDKKIILLNPLKEKIRV